MAESEILSGEGVRTKFFESTTVSMDHNFFMPTYISRGVRAFLPPPLVELALDCIFATLGRELKAGRGENPLEFSCDLPTRSPRRGYVLVPVELTARLKIKDEGIFAVVCLRDEDAD